jgi:hypothetical protein
MEYGALIREAWDTTWRHRFLWVLGLFAGGSVGVAFSGGNGQGAQWRASPEEVQRVSPAVAETVAELERWAAANAQELGRWAGANTGPIAGAGLAAVALVVALLAVTLIAQGGMAEATVDLAGGRSTSLGQAWRAGVRLFWRFAGLYLVLAGAAFVIAAIMGAGAVILLAPLMAGSATDPLLAALAIVVSVPLALAGVVAAIGVSIVVAYAQRAIYAEDAGPLGALQAGWAVLRAHPGASALTWLVNLALAIGTGIAAALGVLAVLAVLAATGIGVWNIVDAVAPRVAYAALAAIVFLAGGLLVAAVTNTFFWNYWTLAYLRLSGRGAGQSMGQIEA